MTKKKKDLKPVSKDKQMEHYNAILLEDIDSKMNLVIEHMTGVENRLIRRMDEKFEQIDRRFDGIEVILMEHSRILRRHEERFERIETKLQEHDARFERIETKLDHVIEKVDIHDQALHKMAAI